MGYKLTYIIKKGGEEMDNTNVTVVELKTKDEFMDAIKDDGLSIITLDSGYISEEMLDNHIVESNRYSPRWHTVLASLLFNDAENYDLPRVEWDDLDHYIYRLINIGYVLFTEGDDGSVTIYDADESIVEWSGIHDSVDNKIEIYIPQPGLLEYLFNKFTALEDVLGDLDIHISDLPLLYDEIIDDIDYRFIHDLLVYR